MQTDAMSKTYGNDRAKPWLFRSSLGGGVVLMIAVLVLIFSAVVAGADKLVAIRANDGTWVRVTPKETDEILANPGMGWQTFHTTASDDEILEAVARLVAATFPALLPRPVCRVRLPVAGFWRRDRRGQNTRSWTPPSIAGGADSG